MTRDGGRRVTRVLSTAPLALAVALLVVPNSRVLAHNGPPFPIVSNQAQGAYSISLWTDPDTTDDATAAGQFWVVIDPVNREVEIPPGTQATVTIRPTDREGPARTGRAEPVDGAVTRQYVALLMDHEGPFAVHVTISGPLGTADVDAAVDATYDLRPAPALLFVYLLPFVALGALWAKVLLRRRRRR